MKNMINSTLCMRDQNKEEEEEGRKLERQEGEKQLFILLAALSGSGLVGGEDYLGLAGWWIKST